MLQSRLEQRWVTGWLQEAGADTKWESEQASGSAENGKHVKGSWRRDGDARGAGLGFQVSPDSCKQGAVTQQGVRRWPVWEAGTRWRIETRLESATGTCSGKKAKLELEKQQRSSQPEAAAGMVEEGGSRG